MLRRRPAIITGHVLLVLIILINRLKTYSAAPLPSRRDGSHDNASVSAVVYRGRREVFASQGCGPVCNRCTQVLSLRYSALCLSECEAGLSSNLGRHYEFCLVVLTNPPPGLLRSLLPKLDFH